MEKDNTIELVELMFKVFRSMKEKMSYTDKLTHLSVLQIHTLIFLKHNKKNSMSDIANYFHIELPSATSLVNKLCDQKLVKRYEDEKDRRLVMIALTEGGEALLKQVMCERKKKIKKILSYLSIKERKDLSTILVTLNNKLQK